MNRRDFVKTLGACAVSFVLPGYKERKLFADSPDRLEAMKKILIPLHKQIGKEGPKWKDTS